MSAIFRMPRNARERKIRRTITEITATLIVIGVVAWALFVTRVSAADTVVEIVPVTVRYGDTAWDLCLAHGHEGDPRDCAFTYEGAMQPGRVILLKVTKSIAK